MVPNESYEYPLSNGYKLYILYAFNISSEAKILPLPQLNLRKNAIFGMKVSIYKNFKLHCDCFCIKRIRCVTWNKTSTRKPP